MRGLALPVALALALVVAGCGKDEAAERDVRKTVNGFYDALAAKDAKGVCGSLSKQGKEELSRNTPRGTSRPSCERLFTFGLAFADGAVKQAKDAKVTDVTVDGDQAKATVKYKRESGDVGLVKEAGEWKLTGLALR